MWWILLLLPTVVWALPPSPNAISILPNGVCGNQFACKPTSQCSVWYAELNALPPKPCSDPRGVVGLCCPDVVHVKSTAIKYPEVPIIRLLPPLTPVPPAILANTARAARTDLIHMKVIEENLSRNQMTMSFNSMAWAHSSNMAPLEMAGVQGERALLVVNVARRLQDSLRLSPEQAGLGLQAIDTRLSLLGDTCPILPACVPIKYRSFDGTCNNLRQPSWGSALSPLERLAPPEYDDGIWEPKIRKFGQELPSVRVVRSVLVTDENHPKVDMTHMLMQWGQFLDHDMIHVPVFRTANRSNIECCTREGGTIPPEMRHPHCFPIDIPINDPFYGPRGVRCLNFVRSMIAPRLDCRVGYAEQMNQLTHFIDASHIYGPSPDIASSLREFVGGLLKISVIEGRPYLPQNPQARGCIRTNGFACFVSGDTRVNQIMGLTALHILFLRQHNFLASALAALNPQWNDEILYLEARRIVGALMQHITYNEFLPTLLGRLTMDTYGLTPQTSGYSPSYDENVNPSITNEFGAAAFRMGHSLIQGAMNLVAEDGTVRVELMRHWFDNPHLLRQAGLMDAVLRGLVDQWPQNMDEWVSEDVTNHLFQSAKRDFGFDLVSLNIWRGRDHGLPGYNTYRQVCGLPRVTNFQELLTIMDRSVVDRLASVYRSVDDIDLFIGGLVESHLPGSMLGPVFSCIIADQFARLKEGDRFFFEHGGHPSSFSPAQLQEIRQMSLAAVICDNADQIINIQPLVLRQPSPTNPRVNCKSPMIPRMNLAAWKQ
ncbi:chorion peroxidase-like [Daphnia pulex]|uniref:chorion peroxidase-like n=1 Tax=Daphnia pulex TaxID=6669 RepID=UPI001EDCE785|nr:chorion peroxidase-like [Daphnia pulex]